MIGLYEKWKREDREELLRELSMRRELDRIEEGEEQALRETVVFLTPEPVKKRSFPNDFRRRAG